jgi:hypothetical protein
MQESVKGERDGMPKSWKHCIAGGRKTFYHQGTEVWYKNGMSEDPEKDDDFVVCGGIPENEDINCSSGIPTEFSMAKSAKYMYDHVKYYGQMVCQIWLDLSPPNALVWRTFGQLIC